MPSRCSNVPCTFLGSDQALSSRPSQSLCVFFISDGEALVASPNTFDEESNSTFMSLGDSDEDNRLSLPRMGGEDGKRPRLTPMDGWLQMHGGLDTVRALIQKPIRPGQGP